MGYTRIASRGNEKLYCEDGSCLAGETGNVAVFEMANVDLLKLCRLCALLNLSADGRATRTWLHRRRVIHIQIGFPGRLVQRCGALQGG